VHVWLAHIAEPPPTDPGTRPFRYALLARALRRRGHTVLQWAPTFVHGTKQYRAREDRLLPVAPGHEVQLVHAGGYRRHIGVQRFLFYRRLARRIRELAPRHRRPDLVVVGLPDAAVCRALLDIAGGHDAKAVIDVQDLWPDLFLSVLPQPLRPLAKPLLRPLERLNADAVRRAHGLTAVSKSYLAWGRAFAPGGDRGRDRAFPLAIERPVPDPEAMARERAGLLARGVDPSRLTAVFVGIVSHVSDLKTVLEAWRRLPGEGAPPVQLLICGDGPKRAEFEAMAEGLPHCHFLGWCGADRMAAAMGMASIGLAPYRAGALQSIPNKPLEYLAHGLVVLSTLPGELAAVLKESGCGLTYPAGEPETLARIVADLARNDARREGMRARARTTFAERFEARQVYDAMGAWLEGITEGGHGRTPVCGAVPCPP
jgi:glycosyltransferase involved in cell wall biosynthesis